MKKLAILAGALLISTHAAYAGGVSPFYIGGSYGETDNNTDVGNFLADCNNPPYAGDYCTAEDSDQAWEIHGGLSITPNLSVEVGYADLGNTADMYYSDPIQATQETTAVTVAGVARMPIGNSRASVYGKAGIARWNSEIDVKSDYPNIPSTTYEDDGISPVIGAGVEYDITNSISARVGIDRYYEVGTDNEALQLNNNVIGNNGEVRTIKTDVDVLSAGVNYYFF